MIRSLVKRGIKRALRVDSRPADYRPWPSADASGVGLQDPPAAEDPPVEVPPIEDPPAEGPQAEPTGQQPSAATDDALSMDAVQEVLDDMIRPALQGDGGDITLVRIEDQDIYVKLVGACSTCPSSVITMKAGVEALLKEEFPTVRDIIQVS